MDIETCIRNYLTSGEFNHEAYHPARDFLSGLLDITIVKPVIEFFTGTDLITGERLTEAQKYQKMAGAIVDMFTFGQGLVAMKGAGLVGKELCKAFGKTMLVEVASSASAYTVGYGVEAMGLPPQIAWMLGAATGCIVSTAGMNLVFRNPKTGVVRECSLEEITSLEKLDASEIDIAKLGKEVPTDDLELYMRYQKEGSIEHFTDGEKKTISRIETMGIKGDECEEILRARGKEVTRPPIEEPEAVLPPRNESGSNAKIYNSVEYKGTVKVNGEIKDVSRKVYQRNDIDFNYFDETTGLTNLERMQAGKPPIGSDGNPVQLHHILQKEVGPMVEIREITHQEYYSQLHGLIEDGASFRNNPVLNKQYNNFRRSYWKWRAEQIIGGN